MKKFFGEFKEFLNKGNVIGLAVAVVIGGLFSAIVQSLVNNIITPTLALLMGGNLDFTQLAFHGIGYGLFIQTIINFILTALFLFIMIRTWTKYTEKQKKKEPETPTITDSQYLSDILEELKKLNKKD